LEYQIGDQEAAVKNLLQARGYFRDLGWNQNIAFNNILVGLCFKSLGRNAAAQEQFEAGYALADSIGAAPAAASAIANLGDLHRAQGKFRAAMENYREALRLSAGDTVHVDFFSRYLGMGLSMKGLGMTDSANRYISLAFEVARRHRDHFELGTGMRELAAVALQEENFRECVVRVDSALKWFSVDQNPRGLHDAFALKSECLERMGDFVGALNAQRQAAQWRDSIYSADATESLLALEAQLWTEKNQHYLDLAEKQNELKTKEAQIAQNKSDRLSTQRNWLITIFVLLLLGGGIAWYLNRKRRQNIMQRKITELRIAALRAQMNPHFIFNALGSVQLLINTQKSREANMYLSSFARLLRTILENSGSATLSLEEELEALKLYVQLEALRFKFEYQIEVDEEINPADVRMPGMLIQPLIENAIKHGISGKHQDGRLKVRFHQKEEGLLCVVEDNGIGREEAGKIKREAGLHRSIGIGLIREQLDLIRPFRKDRLRIIDLKDPSGKATGTRIEILLELTPQ
jgi:tetratricopeptide (TPR) repeat protein